MTVKGEVPGRGPDTGENMDDLLKKISRVVGHPVTEDDLTRTAQTPRGVQPITINAVGSGPKMPVTSTNN